MDRSINSLVAIDRHQATAVADVGKVNVVQKDPGSARIGGRVWRNEIGILAEYNAAPVSRVCTVGHAVAVTTDRVVSEGC